MTKRALEDKNEASEEDSINDDPLIYNSFGDTLKPNDYEEREIERKLKIDNCLHNTNPNFHFNWLYLTCDFVSASLYHMDIETYHPLISVHCKLCPFCPTLNTGPKGVNSHDAYQFIYKYLDPFIQHKPTISKELDSFMMNSLGIPNFFIDHVKQCIFEELLYCSSSLPTEIILIVYKHMVLIKAINGGIRYSLNKFYKGHKKAYEKAWETDEDLPKMKKVKFNDPPF